MDLCEKCQFYNKNCVNVSEKEMKIRPFLPKNTQIHENSLNRKNINNYESNGFSLIPSRRSSDHSSISSHNKIAINKVNARLIPQNPKTYGSNSMRTVISSGSRSASNHSLSSSYNYTPVKYNIPVINTRVNSVNTIQRAIESENSVPYYSKNVMRTERLPETQSYSTYSSRYVNTPKVNEHQRREKSCCVIL